MPIKLFKLFIPVFNGMNIQQFLDILRLVERETKEKKKRKFQQWTYKRTIKLCFTIKYLAAK